MLRDCIVDANGKIINIGAWDYQIRPIKVGEDAEGNDIYEDQVTNLLPTGAIVEQRDIINSPDGGLVESGYVDPDQSLIDAINGATTLSELKSALVGGVTNARVRGKRI